MKEKIILFICLILSLSSCIHTKYYVEKESVLRDLDLTISTTNYVPILDNHLKKSPILNTTFNLLQAKKYSEAKKFLYEQETIGSDFYLSMALLFITKSNYSEAIKMVDRINDNSFSVLKRLLLIDLNYEISKKNGNVNYKYFLRQYQQLLDDYPDYIKFQELVSTRIRYLRYNY